MDLDYLFMKDCIALYLFLVAISCKQINQKSEVDGSGEIGPIFRALSPEESGIDFTNYLKEDSVVNYFTNPYIYMGGGVAAGDLKNDGLSDL
jgi:hypothetical protein